MKDFALTVVHPSGEKTNLTATPQEDCYRASFTPTEKGTYTVIMDNDKIEVYDLTKHNIGIFKAYYHATAKIQVGEKIESTIIDNENSITIKNVSEKAGEVKLKVFYKNEILPNHDFNVFVPDQWTKKLRTDEEGYVTFSLPWTGTTYVVEATFKEETSGKYNDIDYNFVWHCASLSVKI